MVCMVFVFDVVLVLAQSLWYSNNTTISITITNTSIEWGLSLD